MTDKENKRKCFKCGCSPAEDNIKLFRFPKPALKNLVRCELWAQYIFPERDYSSMSLQMKLHNEHRMLCQNHFKDKDFTDCTKQKLLRTAVPCDVPTMARLVKPKFVLRCCAPLCSNDADKVTKPTDISFHMFPDSPDLRKLWLDALDLNAWYEKNPEAMETALVCSEHFASADLYNTKTGFRKLRVGAVPLVIQESLEEEMLLDEGDELIEQLQVCRICLETEGRLIPMSQHKLGEIYQNLTGFSMSGDERLSQTFCPECAQRLRNFDRFREKSLTAELLLSNMLKSTESSIREEFTKIEREKYGLPSNLVKLFINYDHFDLFIQEDTQNDHDQITNQSNIGGELTVLNFNTSDVKGASIKIDKLTHIAPKPNVPMNARLAPKPQAPIPNITPNLLQIAPKRNVTSNSMQLAPKTNMTANLRQIRPKLNATPVMHDKREIDTKVYKHTGNVQTRNANRQIDKNTVKRNESVQTTNMNKAIVENQAKVKKEFNTDNEEQTQRVKVDSLPVIDVVIDNKFKIVKKEELLLKNAQIIINNNKTTPIVQELDNHKAIVRNKYGVPIGVDLSKGSLTVRKQNQEIPAMTVLPIMTKDRIIMPNQAPPESMPTPHNRPKSMPQPILKNIQQDGMPILQNLLTTKQLQQVKPKTTPTERSKSISTNQIIKPKNIPTSDDDNRKKATIIRNRKDMPLIEKNQKSMPVIDDDQTEIDDNQMEIQRYEVPITNYEGQEFCEETVVTEDYLDMQSESDTEMNTENEVENMIKKEKESSNANTDSQIESLNEDNATEYNEDENNEMWEEKLDNDETWDENQENNETWDENQENDGTWDVKQENDVTWAGNQENDDTWDEVENTEIWNENSGKWEAEEFSEDNENEQNSDTEQQNDEIPESDNKVDKLDPDTLKKNRMQRKRKSVQLTYGKTYFSDDLNDVIFTIKQLNYEEQLAEIRNRLLTKYKDAAYTCDLCYRGFMHEYAYHRHMGLHDSDDGEFECGVCRFKFRTAKLLECHQAARHATKFSCNLCDFTTTSTEPARQHGTKHRGIRYQCPDCSEECIRYTVLMDHMVIKHTPENLCPVCGLKLVSHEELERHKSVRHEAQSDPNQWESAVHCDRCDILFASEDAYRFHLGVSLKHDSEFISEHQKAKRNQEEYFLKPSSQYKTEVTGPLTCEQCGMILPTLRKYHAHFRRDHPDKTRTFYPTMKKKVMCELCGRFFKAQWQYVEHLRLHTNERPYSCEHCGKTFITNRLLCAHRYIHNARRTRPDIRCKLCGKNFANKGNLHRHMGVHSDEKRFKCEICNTAYRQKAEMKSHYDHVHLRKPWPKRHRPKRDASTSQTKSVPTSEDDTSQQYVVEEVAEEMEIGY